MCFKQLAGNTGLKNDTKIAICASSHNFVGLYFHNWGMYRQLEKIVKQQYLCHMSTQYGELRSTNSLDRFGCLETPANFIGFRVLPLLLQSRRSPEANQTVRCLVVSWDGTLYIHFRGSCPLAEFCPVQNSLYVQVLRSPILSALLHGTPAAGVSQTLRRGTRNGITELSQRAPPTSFTNLSHHRLPCSLRTDSTDFTTGPFLLSISVLCLF